MFEIKQKTKVDVKIYGQQFELKKPTVKQIELLQEHTSLDGKSESEQFRSVCEFLDILGLPKEFSKEMEIGHLLQLVTYVSGELNLDKKKSEAGQ
ncbi:hypothetical protein KDA08_05210 [Candidatus Saccharibacteria bacterium]|nr:hypothetical protein [Candidatus Saccharibacteria bacterium]